MRPLKLILTFWSAALASQMEYRANFVMATIEAVLEAVGKLFGVYLFYTTGFSFGGWRWQEALLVLGMATLVDAFFIGVLNPNLRRISEHVQKGTLDFVLLKPVDSQLWITTQYFSVVGVPFFASGLIIVIYAGLSVHLPVLGWLLLAAAAIASLALAYAIGFLFASTAIWFVKVFNVVFFLNALVWTGQYPVSAYQRPFRIFMTYVLPIYFMTTVPAELALSRQSPAALLLAFGVAAIALFASRAFWRFALRYYTSASS